MRESEPDAGQETRSGKPLGASAIRGGAVTLAGQAARIGIMMVSTVVLARLISPHEYGVFALILAVAGFADIFRDLGLSMACLRAKSLSQAQHSNIFWINTAIGIGIAAIMATGAPLISALLATPDLTEPLRLMAVTFILSGVATQFRVRINRDLRFGLLTSIDVAAQAAGAAVAIVMATLSFGYWSLVGQQLCATLVGLVVAVSAARWLPSWYSRRAGIRELLRFGGGMLGSQGLNYALRNADTVALGRVWGPAVLAPYDRAYQFAMVPIDQMAAPLSRVAVPILSRQTDDPHEFRGMILKAHALSLYVNGIVFASLAGVAAPAVALLLGPAWGEAAPILAIIACGCIFKSAIQSSFWIAMATGSAGRLLRFQLWSQPLAVAVTLSGLPWGARGVAVGATCSFATSYLLSTTWACRLIDGLAPWDFFAIFLRIALVVLVPGALLAHVTQTLVGNDFAQVALGVTTALLWATLAVLVVPLLHSDNVLLRRVLAAAGVSRRLNRVLRHSN